MLGKPPPIAIRSSRPGIDPFDFRRRTQLGDPVVNVVGVILYRVAFGGGEDYKQLVEGTEPLQERAKRRDCLAVTRQKAENVCVEGQPADADARQDNEHERANDDDPAPPVRPRDDQLDG